MRGQTVLQVPPINREEKGASPLTGGLSIKGQFAVPDMHPWMYHWRSPNINKYQKVKSEASKSSSKPRLRCNKFLRSTCSKSCDGTCIFKPNHLKAPWDTLPVHRSFQQCNRMEWIWQQTLSSPLIISLNFCHSGELGTNPPAHAVFKLYREQYWRPSQWSGDASRSLCCPMEPKCSWRCKLKVPMKSAHCQTVLVFIIF